MRKERDEFIESDLIMEFLMWSPFIGVEKYDIIGTQGARKNSGCRFSFHLGKGKKLLTLPELNLFYW